MERRRIAFRMFGVPVRVTAGDAGSARWIDVCYRDLLDPAADVPAAVAASVLPAGGGLEVAIDGRESAVQPDVPAAIQYLNHELLHAAMLRARHAFYVHAGVVSLGTPGPPALGWPRVADASAAAVDARMPGPPRTSVAERDDGRPPGPPRASVASAGAIVLPGLSRAGKSTLALALIQAGCRYLSDELLVFDPATSRALPFPRALKIREVCLPYFAIDPSSFLGTAESRFLDPDRVPTPLAAPATVAAIVLPEWSLDGDDEPRPVERGHALLQVATSALNFGTHKAASIAHLADLCGRAAAFAIRWRDPHRAAGRILASLAGLPA